MLMTFDKLLRLFLYVGLSGLLFKERWVGLRLEQAITPDNFICISAKVFVKYDRVFFHWWQVAHS